MPSRIPRRPPLDVRLILDALQRFVVKALFAVQTVQFVQFLEFAARQINGKAALSTSADSFFALRHFLLSDRVQTVRRARWK